MTADLSPENGARQTPGTHSGDYTPVPASKAVHVDAQTIPPSPFPTATTIIEIVVTASVEAMRLVAGHDRDAVYVSVDDSDPRVAAILRGDQQDAPRLRLDAVWHSPRSGSAGDTPHLWFSVDRESDAPAFQRRELPAAFLRISLPATGDETATAILAHLDAGAVLAIDGHSTRTSTEQLDTTNAVFFCLEPGEITAASMWD